ncbi:MAG: Mini-ribonuclease 3 [Caldanaerobacter subterraneus]|jgi:ribonuclease-3 family protein|uniref:Mini-ribonuclease 3 n=2 Tax=Caldanaerobacter subterraneus TaxID=911092 RepID=A0A101E5J6_9THEO|nr:MULTISPECIES: ribonuclease III domain-containing protein [Caldanaerobacter]ERM91027.1 Mini-ribonuclease 3 [Caldanaerobacter subterraneus subsp. yonseiensis KB-1]KUK08715.1 MAG: Mini-ribonuclease 3 [Caldanaerobacter subterraneus]MBE3579967.1 Mini-ribonuclease 3 [Caldanaerobacter subterraneus]MDI3518895.1 mini-ribonuclease [Caldanaerobacter sp.]TCO54535.1 ribonuclease-3 family protein [Caldanaerobacter subterraneus]
MEKDKMILGKEKGVLDLSPLVLAFIGDAVYSLYVRTKIVEKGNMKLAHLNEQTVKYVKASSQARSLERIYDLLTEEEKEIVRRGRNAKASTVPKGASVKEYRYATAFEALVGYLYLLERFDRLYFLLSLSMEYTEE